MVRRNINYVVLPTVGQWKSDSADAASPREDDGGLLGIDELLSDIQHLPPGASSLGPALIDLFLGLNRWLEARRGEAAHAGRWEAVRALRDAAQAKLGPMLIDARDPEPFDAALARAIRTMKMLGAEPPFSQEKILNRRLLLRGGLVFQLPWWRERPGQDLPLACSERIVGERGERREFLAPTEKASPFIALANQQIFLTRRHRASADLLPLAAAQRDAAHRILMAGMLLVADGRLEALRLDSGDFRPETDDLRGFLTYLKHHGIDLRALRLVDCSGDSIAGVDVNADRFLRSGLPWTQFAGQSAMPRTGRASASGLSGAPSTGDALSIGPGRKAISAPF